LGLVEGPGIGKRSRGALATWINRDGEVET
jgi:hypothetical protein